MVWVVEHKWTIFLRLLVNDPPQATELVLDVLPSEYNTAFLAY
jgi:hypothetical protein